MLLGRMCFKWLNCPCIPDAPGRLLFDSIDIVEVYATGRLRTFCDGFELCIPDVKGHLEGAHHDALAASIKDSERTSDCQSNTAPHEPFFKICSADQSASAKVLRRSRRKLRSTSPQDLYFIACGRYGG